MKAAGAPSLGVAIPALNEAAALPRLLERLSSGPEEDRADRIVVADGGSHDGTPELVLAAGAELVREGRGRGRQLAAAARGLRTDLVLFLHADALPSVGALAALRAQFSDPGVQATAFHQSIEADGRLYRWIESAADLRAQRLGIVYGDSGLCLRRTLYEELGGFRDLPLFEDLEFSRRMRRRARVRIVPEASLSVCPRRWEREGVLRCTLRNWILTLAYGAGVSPERLTRFYPAARRAGLAEEQPVSATESRS